MYRGTKFEDFRRVFDAWEFCCDAPSPRTETYNNGVPIKFVVVYKHFG